MGGYGSHGILGHPYGYGGAMVGYGGIPYTVQASDEGTPASAVRLAATLPYTGYGHPTIWLCWLWTVPWLCSPWLCSTWLCLPWLCLPWLGLCCCCCSR